MTYYLLTGVKIIPFNGLSYTASDWSKTIPESAPVLETASTNVTIIPLNDLSKTGRVRLIRVRLPHCLSVVSLLTPI